MEKRIIEEVKKIMSVQNVRVIERLLGGMSNYTYVVSADDKLYTYRIPGEYAEYFVDRHFEAANIKLMESLGITNKTIYLNVDDGRKLACYAEGVPLSTLPADKYPYKEVVALLKIIHRSDLRSGNDYQPFARLSRYENYIKEMGFVHPARYHELIQTFYQYRSYLAAQPKTLIHGDSQPSNFVYGQDRLLAVDFEFCGNNDPVYDIACFANKEYREGLNLLYAYFTDPGADEKRRFHLWRAFQCLQWFNVAVFKELKGMSLTLKIDFKMVAKHYLELVGFYLDKTALIKEN